jgi:hypothetical protein
MAELWGGGLTYMPSRERLGLSMVEKRLFEYKRLGPSLIVPSHDIDRGARRVASCTDASGINFSAVHARIEQHFDRKCLLPHKLAGALAHYSIKMSAQRWKGRSKSQHIIAELQAYKVCSSSTQTAIDRDYDGTLQGRCWARPSINFCEILRWSAKETPSTGCHPSTYGGNDAASKLDQRSISSTLDYFDNLHCINGRSTFKVKQMIPPNRGLDKLVVWRRDPS